MSNAERIQTTLEQRRLSLVEQCHRERRLLVKHGSEIRNWIEFIETGLRTVSTFGKLPLLGVGVLAAVCLIKPKLARWVIKTSVSAWRIWQKFTPSKT